MTNNTFNWGVIGTGGIANAFTKDIQELGQHKVTAVLSRSITTANSFASTLNSCKSFVDMEIFLDKSNVDAIYIATPNTLHCKQTIACLNAKIPVLFIVINISKLFIKNLLLILGLKKSNN